MKTKCKQQQQQQKKQRLTISKRQLRQQSQGKKQLKASRQISQITASTPFFPYTVLDYQK
jgi:hypothetical protein